MSARALRGLLYGKGIFVQHIPVHWIAIIHLQAIILIDIEGACIAFGYQESSKGTHGCIWAKCQGLCMGWGMLFL